MPYVIRNCPAFRGWLCDEQFLKTDRMLDCKDIHNCLLKRIVEFVKWRDEESVCNSCGLGIPHRKEEFQRILNMLEIEECENE